VVEAAQRSGALLTATHAGNQGRPVFAVPGPVDGIASGGTNELIRKGAILVRSAEDVLEEVEGVAGVMKAERPTTPPVTLDTNEHRIWDFLAERPRHMDEMVQQLGLSVAQLSGMLMMLEMKKVVRRLPGNQYERA
ncbi:MAG TPA: DNA-processing protein DprA, partial [Gemmataceae bacterium]|nr:DNA-processing protein DprA [Gemmataceae bacterium]